MLIKVSAHVLLNGIYLCKILKCQRVIGYFSIITNFICVIPAPPQIAHLYFYKQNRYNILNPINILIFIYIFALPYNYNHFTPILL